MRLTRRALAAAVPAVASCALPPTASAAYPGHNGLIMFGADTGNGSQLKTVRPNRHDLRQITDMVGDGVHPDWSPDGRRIAFELDHQEGGSRSAR